jgi:hypothetical protein
MDEEREERENGIPEAPPPSGHPEVETEDPPRTGDDEPEVPATMPTDDEGRPAPPAAS